MYWCAKGEQAIGDPKGGNCNRTRQAGSTTCLGVICDLACDAIVTSLQTFARVRAF